MKNRTHFALRAGSSPTPASSLNHSLLLPALLAALLALPACSTGPYKGVSTRQVEGAAAARSPYQGAKAPAFSLLNDENRPVTLDSLAGRWAVLYFYPENDTPGCTCQANEFTALLNEFADMNAVVVGVSPNSPVSHKLFREKYGLKIVLLSDIDHSVMRQYGAWMDTPVQDHAAGRVIRSTFIIDPHGKIAWHWPEVIPKGHAERVKEKLAELSRNS